MPRPGPRPYECVRRAWHSERHQPIRGSLIREIFRVVHEIHGSATKKNKEWQEKLPIVVLKAEEIMYSKANSEAEYLDLKTLYDRTNDAIDTIIRRDESTETGDLLQPCIEAALNLGCIPRRASRSQRNNSPRCYLSPNAREHASTPHSSFHKRQTTDPHSMPYYKDMAEVKNMNPVPNHASLKPQAFSSSINYTSGDAWCFPMEACPTPAPDMYAVYPLCYGDMVQPQNSHSGVRKPHNLNFQVMEPSEMSILQKNAETEAIKANLEDLGDCCDLSLRLGPSPMRQRDRNFSFFCKGKG